MNLNGMTQTKVEPQLLKEISSKLKVPHYKNFLCKSTCFPSEQF